MSVPLSAAVRRTVERLLSERFRTPVRITAVEHFGLSPVSRCTLETTGGAAAGRPTVPRIVPPTVIVRVPRDPGAHPERSGLDRLRNEHAALDFLSGTGSALAPSVIVGGAGVGALITEDLGAHPSLLDLLLGTDPDAAREGVLAFARALGALHARTAGRAAEYDDCRARLDPPDLGSEGTEPDGAGAADLAGVPYPVAERWQEVRVAVSRLGLPPPRGVDTDVQRVARTLAAPGPLHALSSGDPSVVNCKVAQGTVRFFDFEGAGFRHALIDAAVLRYFYPTGGPVWQLPPALANQVEPVYRSAFASDPQGSAGAHRAALEDVVYETGMATACAAWTIVRLARLPRVDAGPDRDSWMLLPAGWSAPVPTRSRRRQLVAILETCIAAARRAGTLAALAAWCEILADALRSRWPEATEPLPLYPAFAPPT